MILFFDTSALVKLFSYEKGSLEVKTMITKPSNEIIVLDLALIELQSAIYRKYRNNELEEDQLQGIIHAIENQFDLFTTIPMGADVLEEALSLIKFFGKDHGLRTLDAIHIAGWRIMAESHWHFVTSDKNQLSVVKLLKYKTISV